MIHSAEEGVRSRVNLPTPLRIFIWILFVLFLLFALTFAFRRFMLHNPDTAMSPFSISLFRFDLECFRYRFLRIHQAEFFAPNPLAEVFMYPPLMALVYKFFYHFENRAPLVFYFLTVSGLGVLAFAFVGALSRRGASRRSASLLILSVILLSYPLWLEYWLANMEIVVFFLLAAGVCAFLRNSGYTAAICFGLAAALKIFPLVYFGLLIVRRQYRQAAFGFLFIVGLTIAAFWYICPTLDVSVRGISDGLAHFRTMYMLHFRPENAFDHSGFALIKKLLPALRSTQSLTRILPVYLAGTACAGIVLFFIRICRLPVINQVLCLCIAFVLLPPTSHDYTLLHLYVPWSLLVFACVERRYQNKAQNGIMAAFVCFAIIFSAENEFLFRGSQFGGQIKAVTLIFLMYIALRYPFQATASTPQSLSRNLQTAPKPLL